jgi:hypothetical protein
VTYGNTVMQPKVLAAACGKTMRVGGVHVWWMEPVFFKIGQSTPTVPVAHSIISQLKPILDLWKPNQKFAGRHHFVAKITKR